jgi:preprotein translocase subunit YajC
MGASILIVVVVLLILLISVIVYQVVQQRRSMEAHQSQLDATATSEAVLFQLNAAATIEAGRSVKNIVLSPLSGATLKFNEFISITFDYEHTYTTGVRIFFEPASANVAATASYAPSPLYDQSWQGLSSYVTVDSESDRVEITGIKVSVMDDNDVTLEEWVIDTHYTFTKE